MDVSIFEHATNQGYRIRVYGSEQDEHSNEWYTLYRRLDTLEFGRVRTCDFTRFTRVEQKVVQIQKLEPKIIQSQLGI
jgi:hypothetical protein